MPRKKKKYVITYEGPANKKLIYGDHTICSGEYLLCDRLHKGVINALESNKYAKVHSIDEDKVKEFIAKYDKKVALELVQEKLYLEQKKKRQQEYRQNKEILESKKKLEKIESDLKKKKTKLEEEYLQTTSKYREELEEKKRELLKKEREIKLQKTSLLESKKKRQELYTQVAYDGPLDKYGDSNGLWRKGEWKTVSKSTAEDYKTNKDFKVKEK